MEALAYTLIVILVAYLSHNVREIRKILKERSELKAAARRAASRSRAYRQVHKEWTIYRNRRELSNYLKR